MRFPRRAVFSTVGLIQPGDPGSLAVLTLRIPQGDRVLTGNRNSRFLSSSRAQASGLRPGNAGNPHLQPVSACVQALCDATGMQFGNYGGLLVEQDSWLSGLAVEFARPTELPSFLEKLGLSHTAPGFVSFDGVENSLPVLRRKIEMRARPEVREILIARKLRRWSLIAQYPSFYPQYSASKARRNYLKLLARYPELARRMNLGLRDAYPSI